MGQREDYKAWYYYTVNPRPQYIAHEERIQREKIDSVNSELWKNRL